MNAYDVAAIGGGAAGLSAALFLPAPAGGPPRRRHRRRSACDQRPVPRSSPRPAKDPFAAIAINADLVNEDGGSASNFS